MTILGRGDLSPPRRHHRRRWPVVLLLVLVLLGAAGYVGWRWWESRRSTSTVATTPCPTPSHPPAPADVGTVHVRVLNGTQRAGLAHQVAVLLHRRGLLVHGVGNAPSTAKTYILVQPADLAQMLAVDEQLHGPPVLVHQQQGSRLTLVIGRDWPGLASATEAKAKRARDEAKAHPRPPSCATASPGS